MDNTFAAVEAALADRYRFERQIGQGGMGVVYLARDLKHDRSVAIKILRPGVAMLLGPDRFLREIGIAAQLNHPHIIPLHDSGEAGGHLYYVMPFVSGETLRERLLHAAPLSLDQALGIVRQVASALAHAHGRGVVHRDIKPSNILLNEGFALVADFGLARPVSRADDDEISSVGLPIGTPRYMSPEQAVGAPSVDGRSDLYSLGLVLREMLAGLENVPPRVQEALARCLAADPADRFATAEALIESLDRPELRPAGRRWLKAAAAVGALAGVALVLWRLVGSFGGPPSDAQLDTTRIAVLPFDRQPGAPAFPADLAVRNALSRWTGISVVNGVDVNEALQARGTAPIDRGTASRVARQLGAGRYVRGQIVPFGDSVQVEAVLYDSRAGTVQVERLARLPLDLAGSESIMSRLVDSLLFRGKIPLEHSAPPVGTTSVPAMWRFIEGQEAVAVWDLAAADSGFGRALELDPSFARASLWLAMVRSWRGQPDATWRPLAAQAVAGAARLGPRDAALAGLVEAMSLGAFATACPRWLDLTAVWPAEFPVWYGAATCLSRDGSVLRDPRSPTGWRFRSSYHQAQLAWRRAFTLMPSIYRDSRAAGLRGDQWLLWTVPNRARMGSAVPPDTGFFMGPPTWQGDSLAFLPRRAAQFTSGRAAHAEATTEAIAHQRLAFYELATEWASVEPRNLEAREAVALSLWALGNAAAVDSIRAARAYAYVPRDRVRLGLSEALMRVLLGAPDAAQLSMARAIADSVLALEASGPGIDPWDLATLAALTGRATVTARLIRLASPRTAWRLPPALTGDALALLAFAALGGPADSLRTLERRVADGLSIGVNPARLPAERGEWLGRPLAQVALDMPFPSFAELAGTGDYLIDAEAAYARRDTTEALRLVRRTAATRSGMQPADRMFEAVLPEARLLAAMDHVPEAIELLDPTLSDLRHVSLQFVSDPLGAGLLVRAMAFRAELADRAGDPAGAAMWRRAVRALWSSADPFLAPARQATPPPPAN